MVLAAVLGAAVLHASWNAMLRTGADRLWTSAVLSGVTGLLCAAALSFVSWPARASWPYVLLSGALHVGYFLFLVRAYRTGDFAQTYPIARGSSPLLVTLGAALFAGERLSLGTTVGVFVVAGAIIALAFEGRRFSVASVPSALAVGCFISAYSVTDGVGVRLSGSALGYTVWMCLFWGLAMPLVYLAVRGLKDARRPMADNARAATAGLLSLIAYGLVLWAMERAPLGPVAALRETSVVVAALIGWLVLGQPLGVRRGVACLVIAAGAAWLGYSAHPRPAVPVGRAAQAQGAPTPTVLSPSSVRRL